MQLPTSYILAYCNIFPRYALVRNKKTPKQNLITRVVTTRVANRDCATKYWIWEAILPSGYQHVHAKHTAGPRTLQNTI